MGVDATGRGAAVTGLQPYRVGVPDAALEDLRARLGATRWPSIEPDPTWRYGTDAAALRVLCDHWATGFDWRAVEAELNTYPQFTAEVAGATVHLLYARSPRPGALPLVLLHGWPSTVSEFRHVIGLLTDPTRSGGDPADAFDVVVPSLPGFGFGGPIPGGGWGATRMATALAAVLRELGIERYGVFGTDAGAYVATALAALDDEAVAGLHLQIGGVRLAAQARAAGAAEDPNLTNAERAALDDLARYETVDSGYAFLNATKPHTIAYALTDSPVGQAAWILEKFRTWTAPAPDGPGRPDVVEGVSLDDLLAIIATYWFTGTAASAAEFYAETAAVLARGGLQTARVATGCAVLPDDIVTPSRRWAERVYPNIVHWSEFPRGGHFGALEVPHLLVDDLRTFFRPLR